MSRVDTKHIQAITDLSQAKSLAGQYYVRARKAEDKRDEVIRKNVELSEKIIRLQGILSDIRDVLEIGNASL